MKTLLVIFVLAVSGLASASIKVPCSTGKVKVLTTSYSASSHTTNVKLALFADENDPTDFERWLLIKNISYTLGGHVTKSDVVTDLNIKINVFRGIRICELSVFTR